MTTMLDIPSNCPPILWHYTNINALIDIMKERRFRATHFSFLNDAREIIEGSEHVLNIIMKELPNSSEKELFQKVIDNIKHLQKSNNPIGLYIVSFTKKKDFTTQWQAYTLPEGGCAIGFKSSNLVKAFSGVEDVFREKDSEIVWWGKMPFSPLCKCLYTTNRQIEKIRNSISKTYKSLIIGSEITRSFNNGSNSFDNAYREAHAWDFITYCIGIKHHSFKQEKEWRLVYIKNQNEEIKYDEKHRPYIELRIGKGIKFSDIISEIMISPRGNNTATKKKLEFLLADIGEMDNIRITDSELPLR
ncbi:MAG: DUF2971 domain-containing protein [Thermoguttaceae bacterium]|nr:DUF2971 domain-containing protein [Thermoguttaceae bacterium]